jgi:glycosyltransferase involved in cell wall biosynthesis
LLNSVSIVIPYYNQPAFLPEAVRSARALNHATVEVVVVDDGSAVPAAELLSNQSVRILRTENRGVSAARNLGFANTTGEYLIFLDADDRLRPDAIEHHLRAFAQRPEAGLSFGATQYIDQQGGEVRPPHICRPRRNYFRMLLEGNPIGSPGAAMMKRSAIDNVGLFDERVSMGEDYELYLRLARRFPIVQHSNCVLEYRTHGQNISAAQEKMLLSTLAILDRLEPLLSTSERRRLNHARRRWKHVFRPRNTWTYRLGDLYYGFRAMWGVPLSVYFGGRQ